MKDKTMKKMSEKKMKRKVHKTDSVEYNIGQKPPVVKKKFIEKHGTSSDITTNTKKSPRTSQKRKNVQKFTTDDGSETDIEFQLSKNEIVKESSGELHDSGEEECMEEEVDEYASIKKELSEMSFEDIQKLQERLGTKVYNQVLHGSLKTGKKREQVFKRENKNRPMEMTSKKPVSFLRPVMQIKKKVQRDPRFDDLSGTYSESFFEHSYSFLDDMKSSEKQEIKKQLEKETNPEKKEQMYYLLKRMNQQELTRTQKQKREEMEKRLKQKEKKLVQEGKTPFFLKKAERKKLELAEKFKELKKSGKVDKYLGKKRKKTAQKAKKHLPDRHFSRI